MGFRTITILLAIFLLTLVTAVSYSLYVMEGRPASSPQAKSFEAQGRTSSSDLPESACAAANDAGTCTTRLADLGIEANECCRRYRTCCESAATAEK